MPPRRRLAGLCVVLFTVLAFPRESGAGFADIIWEMSGPQMIGVVLRCRFPFDDTRAECWVSAGAALKGEAEERVWVAVEGAAFVSTGRNNGDIDYKFGRIGMLAFEPMLEFSPVGNIKLAGDRTQRVGVVYLGAGFMINRFVVHGAGPFTKYGVKLRPLAIEFAGWGLEYNVRLYPDGFTPDEFGFGPPRDFDRPFEAVQSIGISIPWLKKKLY